MSSLSIDRVQGGCRGYSSITSLTSWTKCGDFLRLGQVGRLLVGLRPLAVLEQRNSPQRLVEDAPKGLQTDLFGHLGAAFSLGGGFFRGGFRRRALGLRSAASFSSRNSLRFNILRAMILPQTGLNAPTSPLSLANSAPVVPDVSKRGFTPSPSPTEGRSGTPGETRPDRAARRRCGRSPGRSRA